MAIHYASSAVCSPCRFDRMETQQQCTCRDCLPLDGQANPPTHPLPGNVVHMHATVANRLAVLHGPRRRRPTGMAKASPHCHTDHKGICSPSEFITTIVPSLELMGQWAHTVTVSLALCVHSYTIRDYMYSIDNGREWNQTDWLAALNTNTGRTLIPNGMHAHSRHTTKQASKLTALVSNNNTSETKFCVSECFWFPGWLDGRGVCVLIVI